jgi:hypothetical protein
MRTPDSRLKMMDFHQVAHQCALKQIIKIENKFHKLTDGNFSCIPR